MSTNNKGICYDEDSKRTLVNLYQAGGKTQATFCKEYGIAPMALNRWIKQYSTVQIDDGKVLTAKHVKHFQKRNVQLEKELLILKKAIAIFTPHSNNDQKLLISSVFNTILKLYVNPSVLILVLITNITIRNQLIVPQKTRRFPNAFSRFMLTATNVSVHIKSLTFFSIIWHKHQCLTSVPIDANPQITTYVYRQNHSLGHFRQARG